MIKNTLKSLLGDYLIFRLKDFVEQYLPSKNKRTAKLEAITQRKLFYGSFVKAGDLCFDVGANVGNRISPLLALGAKIVAVEPQDSCYQFLKYKFGEKITIIKKGLGASEEIKNFHQSNFSTISSFSEEWIDSVKNTNRFKNASWDKVVKIEMTTLDKLIGVYGLPVFIKIDVEGFELEVLKGLSKPIQMISFEYTVPEQTQRIIECLEQIERYNLSIECNYSIEESMTFASTDWYSAGEFKKIVLTNEFISTAFGDIYVKTKKQN